MFAKKSKGKGPGSNVTIPHIEKNETDYGVEENGPVTARPGEWKSRTVF